MTDMTNAEFIRDLAGRMFRSATPAMGFDQGDTDRLYVIANRLAALEQAGEPGADDPLRASLQGSFCVTESNGHPEPTSRSYRMIFSFPTMEAMHAAHAAYVTGKATYHTSQKKIGTDNGPRGELTTLQRLGQEFDAGEGLQPGQVQWHSSEEDGGPDVGIMIGLGGGKELWLGELLDIEGGGMGFAVYDPEKIAVASLSDWDEVRDIIEQHVAPALAHPPQSRVAADPVGLREALEAVKGALGDCELNPSNYDHDDVSYLNQCAAAAYMLAEAALATPAHPPQSRGQAFDGEGFAIGDPVEKFTGEAIWHGIIVASYLTSKGKRRYVVEVEPQGFQMIAVPSQLRALSSAKRGEA